MQNTLLKIFKGTPDDFSKVIILTPVQYTSDVFHYTIRQKPSFVCLLCYDSQSFGSEKGFDKTIAA